MQSSAQPAAISTHVLTPLTKGWELACVRPGSVADPTQLSQHALDWIPALVPGTVAAALHAAGKWDLRTPRDLDREEVFYRCRFALEHFEATGSAEAARVMLRLDGLATIAEVWLNGVRLLQADNMFIAHELCVTEHVRPENELLIRFSAVHEHLAARRPRPRWRTRLVENQQLRWLRTTLLGRMPGWCPPVAPVGPWRAVTLVQECALHVQDVDVQTRVAGSVGEVRVALRVRSQSAKSVTQAALHVGSHAAELELHSDEKSTADGTVTLTGRVQVPEVALWWPHTHGAQPLYPAHVALQFGPPEPSLQAPQHVRIELAPIGFRTLALDTSGDGFALRINDLPVFCRGACWTPISLATLGGSRAEYRAALELARQAGMNMLRISGTMVYEDDEFYALCDELGILVWQEFMFASMDYPQHDAAFAAAVQREAEQQLARLHAHPCLAVLCGNSEVEQQAAMFGAPRQAWSQTLFSETLAAQCRARCPGVPYFRSSPSSGTDDGALPFQVNTGVAHYYGVGAYLRPLDDARRSEVRFAAECLAFANVPDEAAIEAAFSLRESVAHHPAWKAGVPRDGGAGWDFEDVRDHYLKLLFGADPAALRYADTERYLALGRVVSGEVMAATMAEWRRRRSSCGGALVWLWRDLAPGAGWGLLDSRGEPKAAYHFLRRALQPIAVLLTDEGVNGLYVHLINETADAREAILRLRLFRAGEVAITDVSIPIELPPRTTQELAMSKLLPGFFDVNHAYRFGPPGHDLVSVQLVEESAGELLSDAVFHPLGLPRERERELGLAASAHPRADGGYLLEVRSQRFAYAVAIRADGYRPRDNYFHVLPGQGRRIVLDPIADARTQSRPLRGTAQPLNSACAPVPIVVREP